LNKVGLKRKFSRFNIFSQSVSPFRPFFFIFRVQRMLRPVRKKPLPKITKQNFFWLSYILTGNN